MVTQFPKIFKEMTQLEFFLHGVLQKLIDLAEQTFYFQTIGDFVIQDVHSMMVMEKYLPQIFPQLAKSVNLINPNMKILNLLPCRQKSCKNSFFIKSLFRSFKHKKGNKTYQCTFRLFPYLLIDEHPLGFTIIPEKFIIDTAKISFHTFESFGPNFLIFK